MPTSKPCFRVSLTPEKRNDLNGVHLQAEMNRLTSDGKVRLAATSLEFDHPYDDFAALYPNVKGTVDFGNRDSWHDKYATPEYKQEMAEKLDTSRDHFRDFKYPDQKDPGLGEGMDGRAGTTKILSDGPGMVIANEHTDQHTKDLMVQALDDQDIGLLFIEEFQVGMQPFIDEFLDSPSDDFPPSLKKKLDSYKTAWEVDFEPLLRKAKQKGARVYGIDSAEAHYVSSDDPRHHESRCAVMNEVSEKVMKDAIKKYPNKKFVAMCGSAHATTHEGGIPGLAEIMNVPSVRVSPNGKMTHDPEEKKNRKMPAKELQRFADKFSDQVLAAYKKVQDKNAGDESIDMIELKVQSTKLAEALHKAGRLTGEKDIAKQLASKEAKKLQQDLIDRTKKRHSVRQELKGLVDTGKHDDLAQRLDAFKRDDPFGFGNEYEMTGSTMLHYAAEQGQVGCIHALLERGSDLESYDSGTGNPGMTPLQKAAANGRGAAVQALLDKGANPNVKTKKSPKQTALHLAAKVSGDCVQKLIAKGADVGAVDKDGKSAMQLATESGQSESCRQLFDGGATVDDTTVEGKAAKALAAKSYFLTVKSALQKPEEFTKKIVDLEEERAKAIKRGDIKKGDPQEVRYSQQIANLKIDLDKAREDAAKTLETYIDEYPEMLSMKNDKEADMTLLHYAAATSNTQAIRKIIAKDKSQLDAKNASGNTPLHLALRARPFLDDTLREDLLTSQDEITDALLGAGAKLNEVNGDGQTPLHLAALTGNASGAERLILGGADVNVKDNRDWTAYDACLASTKTNVEKVFYDNAKASPKFVPKTPNPSIVDILVQATMSEEKGQEGKIREMYEKMYADENLRPILELAAVDAQQDRDPPNPGGVRIFLSNGPATGRLFAAPSWDTGGSGAFDENANTFLLTGKPDAFTDPNGVLIHEMTHMATRKMYGKDTVPYDNKVDEQAYRDAIANDVKSIHLLNDGDKTEARIKNRMSERMNDYVHRGGDSQLLQEYIVGVPQMIAEFGVDAVKKHCPNMLKFYQDFTTKCHDKMVNDPTLQGFHANINNTELDKKLKANPPQLPKAPLGEWVKKDAKDLTVDALMAKIEAEYISRHGELKPLPGTTVPFGSSSFKLKQEDENAFKLKMSRVRTALMANFKPDQLASEINPDAIRSLVAETISIVENAKKVDDIDGMVSGNTTNWARDTKIRLVDHKLQQGKTMDPTELAEATLLLAESQALGKLGNGDPYAVVDVDPGKHKALIKSLAGDLDKKLKGLSPDKVKKLMPQLATAIVDNPKSPFSIKKKNQVNDPTHVSVDKKGAKRIWLQKLKSI